MVADRIFIEGLRLPCHVGITPKEREEQQDVLIDASLVLDLARAGKSDRAADSVDYKEAMQVIFSVASDSEFVLLEGLAESIAQAILGFSPVSKVTVRARKAKYSGEPSVGIEIERLRKRRSRQS